MNPTYILEIFPPKNSKDQKRILQFIKEAPFSYNYWQVFKSLYKKSEGNPIPEIMAALIQRLDYAPIPDSSQKHPSAKTMGYMKRRARRFLKSIVDTNPELYAHICSHLLKNQVNPVNYTHQWVTLDTLLGNSLKVKQKNHGRRGYKTLGDDRFYARREERAPSIWDANTETVYQLLATNPPYTEIQAFGAKVLLRNHKTLPSFPAKTLKEWLNGKETWLKYVGVHQAFKLLEDEMLSDPETLAGVYFWLPNDLKQRMPSLLLPIFARKIKKKQDPKAGYWDHLVKKVFGLGGMAPPGETQAERGQQFSKKSWYNRFIPRLTALTLAELGKKKDSPRINMAAQYLLTQKKYVPLKDLKNRASALFSSKRKHVESLAFWAAEKCTPKDMPTWLAAIDPKDDEKRIKLENLFVQKLRYAKKDKSLFSRFINSHNKNTCLFGWRLLANENEKLQREVTRRVWRNLYWRSSTSAMFLAAIQSPHAAELLVKYCKSELNWMGWYYQNVIATINVGHPLLKPLAKKLLMDKAVSSPLRWLYYIEQLQQDRDTIIETLFERGAFAPSKLSRWDWCSTMLSDSKEWERKILVKAVEDHPLDKNFTRNIAQQIIRNYRAEQAQKLINRSLAIKHKEFVEHFIACLKDQIIKYPAYIDKVAPVFDLISPNLDGAGTLQLIQSVSDQNWEKVKASLLAHSISKNPLDFWQNVLKAIPEEESSQLADRTIRDEVIAQSFYDLEDTGILDIRHIMFTDLMYAWVQKHPDLFEANSPELLRACTHAIEPVRSWGLNRAKSLGIDMPFALRLLESDVPPAMKAGEEYFEQVKSGSSLEFEYALALCDSPSKPVRDFGLRFVKTRTKSLNRPQILACLSEHSDTNIHEYVANALERELITENFIRQFDEEMLRTRHRSRKAKELVKMRVERTLDVSPEVLLSLARGRDKQDAEWAILQLTKMALSGREIKGFSLS